MRSCPDSRYIRVFNAEPSATLNRKPCVRPACRIGRVREAICLATAGGPSHNGPVAAEGAEPATELPFTVVVLTSAGGKEFRARGWTTG